MPGAVLGNELLPVWNHLLSALRRQFSEPAVLDLNGLHRELWNRLRQPSDRSVPVPGNQLPDRLDAQRNELLVVSDGLYSLWFASAVLPKRQPSERRAGLSGGSDLFDCEPLVPR
jgi:hypothetical protein